MIPLPSPLTLHRVSRLATGLVLGVSLLSLVADSRAQIAFNDAALTAGVGTEYYSGTSQHGGGVIWFDYDNDGWPDLFMVNGNGFDCHLFRNEGDGTFSNQDALLPFIDTGLELTALASADYDNDGDVDVYVNAATATSASDGPPNLLLKNLWVENGGGTMPGDPLFEDVAAAAGVDHLATPPLGPLPGYGNYTLGWLDYDRDGCVDLFVGGMSFNNGGEESNRNTLYQNNCDGTFTDVSNGAGLNDGGVDWLRPTLVMAAGHLNDDLFPDLYIVNVQEESPMHFDLIFLNNGDGTFTEVATGMPGIGDDSGAGMGIDLADIDLDGDWDMYISDFLTNQNEPVSEGNVLYLGNSDGTWNENSAPAAGVAGQDSWGVTFFDADHDSYEDLFLGGMHSHVMYQNNQDATFTDVSATAGMLGGFGGPPNGARGSAYADYDRDGDLDIIVHNMHGNLTLYENVTTGLGNRLQIALDATVSNRSAIGTLVRVKEGGRTLMRQMKGVVSAHSQDEALLHFGLDDRTILDLVKIHWPSGAIQKFNNVVANQRLTVTEAAPYLEADGMVVFEAEDEDANGLMDDQQWSETTAFADYSGAGAMEAGPDIGTRITNPNLGGPELSYLVDFSTAGTYYVWVRGWAPNGQGRRVHVGLGGNFNISNGRFVTLPSTGSWLWTNTVPSGRATIEVPAPAKHTINIGMAQDGFVIDKVIVTTDPDFIPVGQGPNATPRGILNPLASAVASAPSPAGAQVETAPLSFGLGSAYPNPFSGTTTISYATPGSGQVDISVFDLLGRRVATLVSEEIPAGRHEVTWDAGNLPSGMYFVRLTAGSHISTARLSVVN